jgi:thioredoxin-dependent peroxiredoxin
MPELSVGDVAPNFNAPAVTRTGEATLSPADFKGKSSLVLYFYPADDTPGCTREACSFRDMLADFQAAGSAIVGVSPDNQASHVKFAEKHALPFPLVADPDHAIAEAYGAWKEKVNYGKRYMGIQRSTFVIDKSGKIAKIWGSVKVDEHVEKVLAFVKGM